MNRCRHAGYSVAICGSVSDDLNDAARVCTDDIFSCQSDSSCTHGMLSAFGIGSRRVCFMCCVINYFCFK